MARNKHEAAFERWRDENPKVMALFEGFARQRMLVKRRFGVKALYERVRWELALPSDSSSGGYKLSNSHTAYMARELCRRIPGLDQYITLRPIKQDPEFKAAA